MFLLEEGHRLKTLHIPVFSYGIFLDLGRDFADLKSLKNNWRKQT